MASAPFSLHFLSLFLLLLLHQPLFSTANLHRLYHRRPQILTDQTTPIQDDPPTLYFEVTKPIDLPKTKPCSQLILHHDFGYTYGESPVLANYSPPSDCPSRKFSKIVLEWKATCKGRQFDRIFGVWLGGVELLRSCTAEPRATGIVWSVEKDLTRYHSLLLKNQTLAVYLGNLVDKTYTGVYHVDISIHFYPAAKEHFDPKRDDLASGYNSWADLVLPISRKLPLKDGLWFEIKNSADTALKEFIIPRNVYRAVLEVYVSFHENDEFWYSNLPNEYIASNNLTGMAGNGPFREVVVGLDDEVVGAIWPFTVIYTGGVNPLLWRPITGIGSFDLPSYDIDITPFLGRILDGKFHNISFSVTDALNVWFIDANLHLWLDKQSAKTEGDLSKHISSPLVVSMDYEFNGLDGTFLTIVGRSVLSTGWVKSSYGNITTHSVQDLYYSNSMVMGNDGNMQIVNQTIYFNDSVHAETPSSNIYSLTSNKTFSLYLYSNELSQGKGTYLSVANVTLGFNEKSSKDAGLGLSKTFLANLQNAQGSMIVKDNLVSSGVGSTQEVYSYVGSESCYFRNISSSNYTILYDEVGYTCQEKGQSRLHFGFSKWWPFHDRKPFLGFSKWWPFHDRKPFLTSDLLVNNKGV